jgi:hypothetical protein
MVRSFDDTLGTAVQKLNGSITDLDDYLSELSDVLTRRRAS